MKSTYIYIHIYVCIGVFTVTRNYTIVDDEYALHWYESNTIIDIIITNIYN